MAAKRSQDIAAAKAKKQKIILIVGGVMLLAVAGLQGPKLLGHGSGSSAAPATGATASTTLVPVTGAGSTTTASVKGSAVVAGVALPRGAAVKVTTGQLSSFTLFAAKDPFVPKVSDQITGTQAASGAADNQNGTTPPAGSGQASSSSGSGGSSSAPTQAPATPAAPAPPTVYATINLDGKPQQVQVKGQFPADNPLFVLRSLKKKEAKIGVAGGSFDNGKPVTLKFGKSLTLVNTATGVRYELKLVYTGSQPEAIQGFTTTQGQTPAPSATTDTTTTTAK